MRLFVISIFFLSLCAGCSSNQLSSQMASWEGKHFDDVASAWGPPNRCGVEEGQKICTWSSPDSVDLDQYPPERESAANLALRRSSCIRKLAFDQSGHVTGWRWRGTRCGNSTIVAQVH